MMSDLRKIRNIGEKMEAMLISVGIATAAELDKVGAKGAQLRLLKKGKANHVMYYQSMWLGLQGRAWNNATDEEKALIKSEFKAIQAEAKLSFINSSDLPPQIAQEIANFGVY